MNKLMKKLFAAVLVLALAASCLPFSVFATGEPLPSAGRIYEMDEFADGARYLLVVSGTDFAVSGYNDEVPGWFDVTAKPEGDLEGYIDDITTDDVFTLSLAGDGYVVMGSPAGDIAPRGHDEGVAPVDGIRIVDGAKWKIAFSEDGTCTFTAYDEEGFESRLAYDKELDIVYATVDSDSDNFEARFKLYVVIEGYESNYEAIDKVSINVPELLCGDEVKAVDLPEPKGEVRLAFDGPDYENYPGLSVAENAPYGIRYAYWVEPSEDGFLGYGMIEESKTAHGGEKYYIAVMLLTDTYAGIIGIGPETEDVFHIFTSETEIEVSNGKVVASQPLASEDDGFFELAVVIEVEAEHVPGESVETVTQEPTCLDPGTYEDVTCCSVCGDELERHEGMIEPLGHDWGEWETVKEPTETEPGLQQRVCRRDPSHVETREIDPLGENPDTGDASALTAWAVLTLVSLGAVITLRRRVRA